MLVSKHIENNVLILHYLRLIELNDCSANNITAYIKSFLLKKENPFMTSVHCIAHRLHLVGQDAAKEVTYFKEYEIICKQLYGYFSGFYKQMQNLKLMQDMNEDSQLIILNIINTQ